MYINKRRTTKYRLETWLLMTIYHRFIKMLLFLKKKEEKDIFGYYYIEALAVVPLRYRPVHGVSVLIAYTKSKGYYLHCSRTQRRLSSINNN